MFDSKLSRRKRVDSREKYYFEAKLARFDMTPAQYEAQVRLATQRMGILSRLFDYVFTGNDWALYRSAAAHVDTDELANYLWEHGNLPTHD